MTPRRGRPPWAVCAVLLIVLAHDVHGLLKPSDNMKEIYDLMYKDILGYPCVRLLHRTGRVGCVAPKGGATGNVRNVLSAEQLTRFLLEPPSESHILLLHEQYLNPTDLDSLAKTGRVAGIVVAQNATVPFASYSPELPFPGSFGASPSPSYVWNPPGSGLMYREFDFPIWYVKADSAADIRAAGEYNDAHSGYVGAYAVQINSEMLASGNSLDCIAEGRCLPLGGQSVLATLNAPFDGKPRRKVIFALAALDSAAFFHDLSYGADADLSGLVATVAAAAALHPVKPRLAGLKHQIAFAALGAEQWGSVGSRALVSRLRLADTAPSDAKAYPYTALSEVAAVVQVRQVGRLAPGAAAGSRRLYRFQEAGAGALADNVALAALADALAARYPAAVEVRGATAGRLPPSSAGAFLQARAGTPHLLLAEHDAAYSNPFFHSRFDAAGRAAWEDVCAAGTFLARLLYAAAAEDAALPEIDAIQADCARVRELLDCFLVDATCSLFRTILPNLVSPSGPLSLYTSVADGSLRPVPALVGALLVNASVSTASSLAACSSNADCPKDAAGVWLEYCVLGVRRCARLSVNYTEALSPAFERDAAYTTLRYKVVDSGGSDPLWTESYWPDGIGVRLFMRTSTPAEVGVLFVGLAVLGLSLLAAWRWARYYEASMKLS